MLQARYRIQSSQASVHHFDSIPMTMLPDEALCTELAPQ